MRKRIIQAETTAPPMEVHPAILKVLGVTKARTPIQGGITATATILRITDEGCPPALSYSSSL
jgi:hypothetical protein